MPRILTTSLFIWMVAGLSSFIVHAQDLPAADELLEKTLAYHDPDGQWFSRNHTLELVSRRPSGEERPTTLLLQNREGVFAMEMDRDGHRIEARTTPDGCSAAIDGSATYTKEQEESYGLSCEGIARMRDYHGYLVGLPMKLRDPGTRLDPEARRDTFMEKEVITLRVTYDENVGSDVWYFYLDPATHALVGTRFYHDESKNDGEYLTFERETEHEGIRLPKIRKWYYNSSGEYLGEDEIMRFDGN